jgi:hypothetical protein
MYTIKSSSGYVVCAGIGVDGGQPNALKIELVAWRHFYERRTPPVDAERRRLFLAAGVPPADCGTATPASAAVVPSPSRGAAPPGETSSSDVSPPLLENGKMGEGTSFVVRRRREERPSSFVVRRRRRREERNGGRRDSSFPFIFLILSGSR